MFNCNAVYMDAQLIISTDKEVIYKGKKYAEENGTTISSLVENYLNER